MVDVAAPELRCAGCEREIDRCAFCDEEDCAKAVCNECLCLELGERTPPIHEHGG
jgi:hypothetical protein